MSFKTSLAITTLSLTLSGCSTTIGSIGMGVGIGASAAGGVAALSKGDTKSIMIGTALGAGIGAGIGYLAHKGKEREDLRIGLLSKKIRPKSKPKLLKPAVQVLWVPDKIDGPKFTQGHWTFTITTPANWAK